MSQDLPFAAVADVSPRLGAARWVRAEIRRTGNTVFVQPEPIVEVASDGSAALHGEHGHRRRQFLGGV